MFGLSVGLGMGPSAGQAEAGPDRIYRGPSWGSPRHYWQRPLGGDA